MSDCDNTREKRVYGRPFEIGNPGKPKGARHKLQEDFIRDVQAAWEASGPAAITSMVADKPGDFVKMVASLLPKDVNLNVNNTDELSDAELAERIRGLAAQLAPFLVDGTGDADKGTEGPAVAAVASSVH